MRYVTCLLLAVLGAATGCSKKGQPRIVAIDSTLATKSAPRWEEFTHSAGRYTVLMPGAPQETVQDVPTPAGKMKLTSTAVELKDEGKVFAVLFADYDPRADYSDEAFAHRVIEAVLAGSVRSRKGEVRKQAKIKLGSHHGQECLFDTAGGAEKTLARVYLVGNRLYQLVSSWPVRAGATSADAEKFCNSFKVLGEGARAASLIEARRGFETRLTRRATARQAVPEPPAELFRTDRYDAPVGRLAAYLTPDPRDGKRRPAIIWITGGDCNTIDQGCWKEGPPSNDQSAAAYRKAGIVMMFPSLRGGNDNPGVKESFLGEVDDVLAAAKYLGKQEFVDPGRIYLGGHSTGGTLALLAAECSDRFRAVFSFGPADNVAGYGPEYLPFDTTNRREIELRSPGRWLSSIRVPTFVFEGTVGGNLASLQAMARASTNPRVHFLKVRKANHFSLLAPTNRLIAQKILLDKGPDSKLAFTEEEVSKTFTRRDATKGD
jgi:hypothetical protein